MQRHDDHDEIIYFLQILLTSYINVIFRDFECGNSIQQINMFNYIFDTLTLLMTSIINKE